MKVFPATLALRFPVFVGPTAEVMFEAVPYWMLPEATLIAGTLFLYKERLRPSLHCESRGKLRDALAAYTKPHVLVVDEVGYLTYGDDAANVLYHVVNDRHIQRRSMIFTTNKDPKRWGSVLHYDDLAEAIVDRILERGRLLRLDGSSLRTKHLAADELSETSYAQPEPARVSGRDRPESLGRTTLVLELARMCAPQDVLGTQRHGRTTLGADQHPALRFSFVGHGTCSQPLERAPNRRERVRKRGSVLVTDGNVLATDGACSSPMGTCP
jgi:hypothetical protein